MWGMLSEDWGDLYPNLPKKSIGKKGKKGIEGNKGPQGSFSSFVCFTGKSSKKGVYSGELNKKGDNGERGDQVGKGWKKGGKTKGCPMHKGKYVSDGGNTAQKNRI